MRTFFVKGQSFESPYSDQEAISKIQTLGGNSFALSLASQYARRGALSDRQWPWVHKLAVDADRPAQPALGSFPAIVAFFAVAVEGGLKRPKISFSTPMEVKLSLAGPRSRNAGSIHVAEGSYPGKYFGHIKPTGEFFPGRDYEPAILSFLEEFSKDPVGMAIRSGKESGSCVFCSIELTTDESVSAGYGPVCAKKWGLPWGNRKGLHTVQEVLGAKLDPKKFLDPDGKLREVS